MEMISLQGVQAPNLLLAAQIVTLVKPVLLKVPVNPPDIVAIDDTWFTVDMNRMEPFVPCVVEFLDSRYVIWKNKDSGLVLTEVE